MGMTDEQREREHASEFNIILMGPVHGWLCPKCGEFRLGHPSEERAKKSAESHAISKHAPPFAPGKTSMTLYVKWDDEESN